MLRSSKRERKRQYCVEIKVVNELIVLSAKKVIKIFSPVFIHAKFHQDQTSQTNIKSFES